MANMCAALTQPRCDMREVIGACTGGLEAQSPLQASPASAASTAVNNAPVFWAALLHWGSDKSLLLNLQQRLLCTCNSS